VSTGSLDSATAGPAATADCEGAPSLPSRRFQILSLDGGGYKGVFSVAVLASLEEDLGIRVLDHFDLVAGTSTGGIIALALGAGLSPAEILEFYLREGRFIFPAGPIRKVRQLFKSKYSDGPLKKAVEDVFKDTCLWQSRVPLCIPSYDLRSDDVYLFRTPHSKRLARDWRERMADIALATSAAPTFLPAQRLRQLRLVDGGVWSNNPSLLAVTEAVSEFGIDLRDIRVLSLGTTSDLGVNHGRLDGGGLLPWASAVTPLILRGQNRAAENATYHLLPRGQFVRINPDVPKDVLRLDGVEPDELRGRAETESRKTSELISDTFLCHRSGPYTPHHTPKDKP
jgi:patatin-like phospholipase/acyl hydrolase